MKNKSWIIQVGISLAALIVLTSCATTAIEPLTENHQIDVYLAGDRVMISQNDMVKAVRSNDNLQWKVRPGIALKEIDIEFVALKSSNPGPACASDVEGNPCQNTMQHFKPVITCVLKDKLGPKDPNKHHDYCYAIHGQDGDGKTFTSLDPIVRGRR
jgi:hypothetical protein